MDEKIEQLLVKILNQVSDEELLRNRHLGKQTARVLRALKYMKVTMGNPTGLGRKSGV